jgi:hypothetical protein
MRFEHPFRLPLRYARPQAALVKSYPNVRIGRRFPAGPPFADRNERGAWRHGPSVSATSRAIGAKRRFQSRFAPDWGAQMHGFENNKCRHLELFQFRWNWNRAPVFFRRIFLARTGVHLAGKCSRDRSPRPTSIGRSGFPSIAIGREDYRAFRARCGSIRSGIRVPSCRLNLRSGHSCAVPSLSGRR